MHADLASAYRGRRACVTGGAGFIGSHLVEALVDLGAAVTVIDDLTSGRAENLAAVGGGVNLVEASILDPRPVLEAAGTADVIFHQAALTSVPASVENPLRYHEVNATGTLRVLEAVRLGPRGDDGPARVVYASSSSAYGDNDADPLVETLPQRPLSPYAASKCAGELLVRAYARCYGLTAVSLRYFNVFGPRQRADSPYAAVIPKFADAMRGGRRPTIYGDGRQTRDFTHVANAVRANLLAGAVPGEPRGEVVNVACGASCDLITLLKKMAAILGAKPDYDTAPPRVGDVLHSRADISAARGLLGYEPVMGLDEGLRDALGARAQG